MRRLIPLFFLLSFTCRDEPSCAGDSLKSKCPFPIGVAIHTSRLKHNGTYRTTATAHFNSFTPEMVLKPQFIHPRRSVFYFTEMDRLMEYCSYYKIRLHGHALLWHKSLPAWLEKFKGSPEEWDVLLKEHVQSIVRHCKGYIKSWDVVNEAFQDDGSLRNNIWLRNLGKDYIEKAFRYVMEEDSSALLFYNDYSLEKKGPKLQAVLKFLSALKHKGVKVDGIGFQMHVNLEYPAVHEILEASLLVQEHGFMLHYSELDLSIGGEQTFFISRKKLLQLQKEKMKQIVQGYLKLDPARRFGITLWGVGDGDSWLSEDHWRARPLLFDRHYHPKPAFCGFREALDVAAEENTEATKK